MARKKKNTSKDKKNQPAISPSSLVGMITTNVVQVHEGALSCALAVADWAGAQEVVPQVLELAEAFPDLALRVAQILEETRMGATPFAIYAHLVGLRAASKLPLDGPTNLYFQILTKTYSTQLQVHLAQIKAQKSDPAPVKSRFRKDRGLERRTKPGFRKTGC